QNLDFHVAWLHKNGAGAKTRLQFTQLRKLVANCTNEKNTDLYLQLSTLDQIRSEKSADFLPLEI
ncbi:MAG: hypothetical protein ACI9YL_001882, partial [Luteibaculaceae bacterium]